MRKDTDAMLAHLLADILPIDSNFDFTPDPKPYIAIFGIGFMIAVVGHVSRSKTLIATGLVLIFLATVLLPLGIYLRG
jgi:hypothetical protein